MECIVKENDILVNIYTNESERVLWIDENNLFCYCIQIMTQKFKVNKVTIEEINSKFDNGIYTIMPKDNTYKIADINKLTEYRREQLELRSKIIKEIDNMSTVPSCFTKKNRGILIENVLERYEVSKKTVYNWLRKYWQGGRTLDSLIDEYDNCGKSTVKKYKKKPGRKISACLGNDDFNGIIITDDVKKIFKQGIKRYKNNESLSLKKTFDYIISDNYYDKLWYEKPTYNQFYYWYQNEVNIDEMVKSRKGEKNYQNNLRALKSDSIYDSPFPGFRYQVDSTIFPIYLVN